MKTIEKIIRLTQELHCGNRTKSFIIFMTENFFPNPIHSDTGRTENESCPNHCRFKRAFQTSPIIIHFSYVTV